MPQCYIVQDLLPSYIEGLVSEETRMDIKEHLDSCPACRQLCEQMGSTEIAVPSPSVSTREINYLKKISSRTRKSIAMAVGGLLIAFGILFWIFAIGWRAKAGDVEIFTEFQRAGDYGITDRDMEKVYLGQSWVIHLELANGRAFSDIPVEFVYDESNVEVGRILTVYETPSWPVHSVTRYATGYSYGGTEAPPSDFDYIVTVRFRDREVVYSMRDEGLFTE